MHVIIWQPFVPPEQRLVVQPKTPILSNLPNQLLGVVSARQFLKGMDNEAPISAIQVRTKISPANESGYPAFLQEFAAVFPAELPNSLPPDRSVQHFIDFIPNLLYRIFPIIDSIPRRVSSSNDRFKNCSPVASSGRVTAHAPYPLS